MAFDPITRQEVFDEADAYCQGSLPVLRALRSHVPTEELSEQFRSALCSGSYTLRELNFHDLVDPYSDMLGLIDDELDPENPEHVAVSIAQFQRAVLRRDLPGELRRLDQEGLLDQPRDAARIALANVLHKPGFATHLYEEGTGFHLLSLILVHIQLTKFTPDKLDFWDFTVALKNLGFNFFSETGQSWRLNWIEENMNDHALDPDLRYTTSDVIKISKRFKHHLKKLFAEFGPYAPVET